jgi:prepilin-type N-terminal cleavage/methylation domain-containing protein
VQHRRSPRGGYTLLEIMVVLAILALALGIGLPNLMQLLFRARLEGIARDTATVMQSARLSAIKNQRPAQVEIDSGTGVISAFVDEDQDNTLDAGEIVLGRLNLPAGVLLDAPGGMPAVEGFAVVGTRAFAVFKSDGSVDVQGAFRMADSRDNYLEIRVAPRGTARIEVRKWDGSNWWARDEGGHAWLWN